MGESECVSQTPRAPLGVDICSQRARLARDCEEQHSSSSAAKATNHGLKEQFEKIPMKGSAWSVDESHPHATKPKVDSAIHKSFDSKAQQSCLPASARTRKSLRRRRASAVSRFCKWQPLLESVPEAVEDPESLLQPRSMEDATIQAQLLQTDRKLKSKSSQRFELQNSQERHPSVNLPVDPTCLQLADFKAHVQFGFPAPPGQLCDKQTVGWRMFDSYQAEIDLMTYYILNNMHEVTAEMMHRYQAECYAYMTGRPIPYEHWE